MLNSETYVCPICGYDKLDEPAYDSYGCASYNICPCCGTELGYDDAKTLHDTIRNVWINKGMPWWSHNVAPPEDWSPIEQLRKANLLK